VPNASRVAKNEHLFREVNEQIHQLEHRFGGNPTTRFICECARRDCTLRIEATLEEYRAVRLDTTHFLVERSHVDPEHERVIRSTDRFTVVEKLGEAGAIADAEADS
jgi:hypothetical protein